VEKSGKAVSNLEIAPNNGLKPYGSNI